MMNIKNTTVTVGLIAGRHPLPVNDYIFDKIENVMNFEEIADKIYNFLKEKVGISAHTGQGINQAEGYDDIEIFHGDRPLVVYVTGLTPVTAELIRLCALNGVSLTLMHYNSATGDYVPQKIFG